MTVWERAGIAIGLGVLAILVMIGIGAAMRLWWVGRVKRRQAFAAIASDVAALRSAQSAAQRRVFDLTDVRDPIGAAAIALSGDDPGWHVVQASGCLTGTRGWRDGTTDTVVLFETGTGYAVREDPDGSAVLWTVKGSLEHVVNSVLSVPAPDAPDAPRGSGIASPRGAWR